MKFLIAFACLLAVAVANEDAEVITNKQEVNVDSFKYASKLSNSADVEQYGNLNGEEWVVKGKHGWTSPEGQQVEYNYIADANGYQVLSANPPLPTPPPIPEAIKRAIEWIKAHPSKDA
ncbi:cuticular protein 47Eg [Drosophila eugracilis]|uniref:cuticular protein 47Eg n=1 Tax=Drosophila eugracilis TaxID=29029 RepID=UPI0007E8556C|nr:cuticular protein 47Eg [Drosophila eugracilis]